MLSFDFWLWRYQSSKVDQVQQVHRPNQKFLFGQQEKSLDPKCFVDTYKCSKILFSEFEKTTNFEGILRSNFGDNKFRNFLLLLFIAIHRNFFSPTILAVDLVLDKISEF